MSNSLSPTDGAVEQPESPLLPSGKFVLIKDGAIIGYLNHYYTACRYGFTHFERAISPWRDHP